MRARGRPGGGPFVTHPYKYLVSATDAGDLIDELCAWHDRMVAHVRRHGATPRVCTCADDEICPRREAVTLWAQARQALGDAAAPLTFLRQHAEATHPG